MSNVNEIMSKYTAGEITAEDANEQLRQQGAGFHLVPLTDEERAAQKQREDEEGTIDVGRGNEPVYLKTPNMRRRTDLKGQVVIQRVVSGHFAVFYDEDGYAVKARRVTFAE